MPVAIENGFLVHAETRERIGRVNGGVQPDGEGSFIWGIHVPSSVPTLKPLPPTPEERANEVFRRYHAPFDRVQDAPNLVELVASAIRSDRADMKASEA